MGRVELTPIWLLLICFRVGSALYMHLSNDVRPWLRQASPSAAANTTRRPEMNNKAVDINWSTLKVLIKYNK